MRLSTILAIVLVAAALAGCANNGNNTTTTPTGNTTTTPPATTPTTTTVVPTVTTPVPPTTPTPPVDLGATITAVRVISLTDSAGSGGNADICWRVEGNGTIGHTAVHFDTVSHPNSTSFTDYPQAVYPDNGPATTTGTFKLPGTFCAQIRSLNATTYLRAHALAAGTPPTQKLSVEKVIPVNVTSTITIVNFREIFPATFSNPVCWEITGLAGASTHTAVHFDTVSHPDSTDFGDYVAGAAYPGNFTPANVSVTLPGEFCGSISMPATGAYWMRAHVIHNGTHYLSEERVVESASRVTVTNGLPAVAAAGSLVNVCWRVEGAGTTVHTALHHDTASHPAANHTGFGQYVGGAVYPDNAPPTAQPWTLPGPFCANLTMPPSGTLFFRPHVFFGPGTTNSEIGPEYAIRVA